MLEKLYRFYFYKIRKFKFKFKLWKIKALYGKNIIVNQDFSFGESFVFNIISLSGKAEIKSGVVFRNFCSVFIMHNGTLSIGANTFFNNFCSINCLGKIEIGDNTLFGEGVKIYDHNHKFKGKNVLIKDQGFEWGVVKVGNNCWIGSNTVILNNVTIGDNVIIGANNIIFKDVPSNLIIKAKSEKIVQEL